MNPSLKPLTTGLRQGSDRTKPVKNRSLPLFNSLTRHISSVLSSSSLVNQITASKTQTSASKPEGGQLQTKTRASKPDIGTDQTDTISTKNATGWSRSGAGYTENGPMELQADAGGTDAMWLRYYYRHG